MSDVLATNPAHLALASCIRLRYLLVRLYIRLSHSCCCVGVLSVRSPGLCSAFFSIVQRSTYQRCFHSLLPQRSFCPREVVGIVLAYRDPVDWILVLRRLGRARFGRVLGVYPR